MTVSLAKGTGPRIAEPYLPNRVKMLGVGIDPVDFAQAVATLDKWRDEARRDYVCCGSVQR